MGKRGSGKEEGPPPYEEMNKTELQLEYADMFFTDVSRSRTRKELIAALKERRPLPGETGVDGLRDVIGEWIRKYYNNARYQLHCDMMCIGCPAGVVADCYLAFKRNYVK